MMIRKVFLSLILVSIGFCSNTYDDPSLLGLSPRSIALGNIGAFDKQASILYLNPSLVGRVKDGVTLFTTTILEEYNYLALAGTYQGYGIGLVRMSISDSTTGIEDGKFVSTGSYSYSDNVFYLSQAYKIEDTILGVSAKFYLANIADNTAMGVNADVSITQKISKDVLYVMTIQNFINSGQKSLFWSDSINHLPLIIDHNLRYRLGFLDFYLKNRYQKQGTTYHYSSVGIRAHFGTMDLLLGFERRPRVGVEMQISGINVAYAYDFRDSLIGNNHYFSIGYQF
jgi:hypothetical protein